MVCTTVGLGITCFLYHSCIYNEVFAVLNISRVQIYLRIFLFFCYHSGLTLVCTPTSLDTFGVVLQRPALIPYHAMELRLIDGEGSWELRSIEAVNSQ